VTEQGTEALRKTNRYPLVTPDQLVTQIEAAGADITVMFHPMAGRRPNSRRKA
jgi:hypothetical protein